MEQPFERDPQAANEPDHAARLRADVEADPVRRVVHAVHRRADCHVDPLGFLFYLCGDHLDVVQDGIDARHRRRDLPRFEPVNERHHATIDKEAGDTDADDEQRFENAHRRDDAEQ